MSAPQTVAVRSRYYARPGRSAIVVSDLASLRGPCRGTVELPLWLYWSDLSPVFDLEDPDIRRWLPKGVRQAWEELHPKLRVGSPRTA